MVSDSLENLGNLELSGKSFDLENLEKSEFIERASKLSLLQLIVKAIGISGDKFSCLAQVKVPMARVSMLFLQNGEF